MTLDAGIIARLPKVDLHCHLIGTVRASTFAELARREGLALPDTPERIYASCNSLPPDPALYRNTRIPVPQGPSADEPEVSYSLFQVSGWVTDVLRDWRPGVVMARRYPLGAEQLHRFDGVVRAHCEPVANGERRKVEAANADKLHIKE